MTSAQSMERKLAVILAADVAGYSRLVGVDEEAALATLSAYRKIIDARIDDHGGRVFGSAGDSVLAEFPSPVEAVRAGVEIQAQLDKHNAKLTETRRMRFRIGINLGDVIVEDDNLLGDGVNVAARLEGLARPGGLCLSAAVFEQVRDRLELEFIDMGEHTVKNIARPVRVYRVPLASEYQPISPFRGLAVFDIQHAEFFHGRSDAIAAAKSRLEQQAAAGRAFLLIYGMSGVGKSSLARAGLLPALTKPGAVAGIKTWRYAILRPAESSSPLAALANALLAETALPELTTVITAGEIEQRFRQTPDSALMVLREALAQAANQPLQAHLLLLVDQLEELFTAEQIDTAAREAFIRVLTLLAESGFIWIIATLRSDFFHRCAEIPGLSELKDGLGSYELLPPTANEIGEIIRRPAQAAGLHFENDAHQGRLDEALQQAAAHDPASLPLLEFTLDALYEAGKSERLLRFADYHALGGLEGAIARRADEVVAGLPEQIQSVLPAVLRALVTVRLGEAGATARAAASRELATSAERRASIDALIGARLVVSSTGVGGPVLRLAHEALLSHWPRAREIITADRVFLETRARIQTDQQRWQAENRNPDLLLPTGRRLSEAEELLAERRDELDQALIDYIEASLAVSQRVALQALRRMQRFAAVMAIFALLAGIGGYLGYTGQRAAELRIIEVESEKARAELQTRLAEQSALFAKEQTQLAEQRAEQFRVVSVVSNAVSAVTDPSIQALLLAALQNSPEPPNGAEIARRILNQAIPRSVLRGHEGTVMSVAFSPDGAHLASTGDDGAVRVWAVDGRGEPRILRGHEGAVRRLIFSPDGALLASAGDDGTVRIWAVDGGSEPRILRDHEKSVRDIVFSPDGARLASAGSDATLRIWAVDGSHEPRVLQGHERGITSIAFSPDGIYLTSASHDGTVRVWIADDGSELRVLQGHERSVLKVIFSPDGTRLASASRDGTVRVWAAYGSGEPQVLQSREHRDPVRSIAFSPDGALLASAGDAGVVSIWTIAGPGKPRVLQGHTQWVASLVFSPDGTRLASASGDGTIRVWAADGHGEPRVLQGHDGRVMNIVFSQDGSLLASAGEDATVRVWAVDRRGEPLVLKESKSGIGALIYSPDGTRLMAYGEDATVRIWSLGNGDDETLVLRNYESAVNVPVFSPNGIYLATAGAGSRDDGTVRVWAAGGDGEPLLVLKGYKGRVENIVFSPDSTRLAITGTEGTVIWVRDIESGGDSRLLRGHESRIRDVAFSPDGNRLASAGQDGTVRVWAVDGAGEPLVLHGHEGWVMGVAFSPDGSRLASGGQDGTVRVWTIGNGSGGKPQVFRGHEGAVGKLIFSPDGSRLASAGEDATVRVWTADGSDEIQVFQHDAHILTHLGASWSLAFSPDGSQLASSSEDGMIRVWATDGTGGPLLLPGYESAVRIVVFSPDGSRLASAYSDGAVRVWTLHWKDLLSRLAASTTDCLSPRQRVAYLFESAGPARAAYDACERRYGRLPRPDELLQ